MLSVFLPCRAGSQRVVNKNLRPFAHFKNGLFELKLEQLLSITEIDRIFVSTNDPNLIKLLQNLNEKRVVLDVRSNDLCTSTTPTDEVIKYVPSIIPSPHIMWTHVTSPFFEASMYRRAINQYFDSLSLGYDSLMGVSLIQDFVWDGTRFLHNTTKNCFWPSTQSLSGLYKVTNSIFIASRDIFRRGNRVGSHIYPFVSDGLATLDIDWPHDFEYAEYMFIKNR